VRFSVVIPTSRPASLGAAIRAIQAQTVADWELLVVGQGEDRGVHRVVEPIIAGDGRVRYLHIDQRGSSRARTAATRAASGEIIAMTDDDCEPRTDWLAVLARALDDEPEVAVVGGALIAPPGTGMQPARCPELIPAEALYDPRVSPRQPPVGWDWIGANFAIRHEVARRVGDWDEHLGVGSEFPAAGDMDYRFRIEALGLKMRTTPRAAVDHTYGWRYGWRAVLGLQRSQARGIGALGAKLTMIGDPRGKSWLAAWRRDRFTRWLRLRQPHRLPSDLRLLWHFTDAYRTCLRNYRVDARGLLASR
jgi:glycosyltransferase involved in cell wall biosynthesis